MLAVLQLAQACCATATGHEDAVESENASSWASMGRGRAGTFLRARTAAAPGNFPDLADLHAAAEALAVTARQLGVDESAAQAAQAALARALDRLQ